MVFMSFFGLYLLSTGVAWALFSFILGEPDFQNVSGDLRSQIENLPKTEECPINGMMYTEPEREIWEGRRPITAVIENHEESRPQSGLSFADVVYEAVAEGGITRFLAVFYCGVSVEDVRIAPIRSARVYFVAWVERILYLYTSGVQIIYAAIVLEGLNLMGKLLKRLMHLGC